MTSGIKNVYKKYAPHPYIIQFQNGNLHEGEQNIQGGIYLDSQENNKPKSIITLDDMIYIGEEKQEENNNFIITRNKITGDINLIQVGNVMVKAFTKFDEELVKVKNVMNTDQTDYKYQLGETFGSKKRKRMLDQSKKLKVDIDSMKEQLEKTINEKQFDSNELNQVNVEPELKTDEYAPPCNRNAEDVKDVYDIDNLITQEQMEALKETAKNVLETEDFDNYIQISEYMKNLIIVLKESSSSDKETKCCIFLYVDCIIRYLSENYKKLTAAKYVLCSYSDSINLSVLNYFSLFSDRGRTRPQHLKDKAICYAIVLLLLSNNYSINDVAAFSKAICTPLSRVSQMCKVVGAHFSGDTKKASIVLKLPLVAPPVMKKRRITK